NLDFSVGRLLLDVQTVGQNVVLGQLVRVNTCAGINLVKGLDFISAKSKDVIERNITVGRNHDRCSIPAAVAIAYASACFKFDKTGPSLFCVDRFGVKL